jgi:hypothetical protein
MANIRCTVGTTDPSDQSSANSGGSLGVTSTAATSSGYLLVVVHFTAATDSQLATNDRSGTGRRNSTNQEIVNPLLLAVK